MARRGVLKLLGCAWTLYMTGIAAAWAAGPVAAAQPILLAQAQAPIVAQAQAPRQQPRLISLDFKDADINNILRILAEFSGLNIVSSEDVKGKVTVKLQNVPWQQALDSVVRAAKLAYVQEGNIIRVDKLENLTKEAEAQFKADQREIEIEQRRQEAKLRREEQERARKEAEEKADRERQEAALERARKELELDLQKKRAEAEAADLKRRAEFEALPLVEEIIPLKYAHVGTRRVQLIDFLTDQVRTEDRPGIEALITGGAKKEEGREAGLLSRRGQLTVDLRTNSLIVRDVPDNLAKLKEFIAKVDRPTAVVLIEARVVEISRDDARRLGVIWGGAFTPRTGSNSPIIDVRGGAAPTGTVSGGTAGALPTSTVVNFPAPSATSFPAAGNLFGLSLGWLASNFALDITLQAMEGEGRARVVSSPNILTLDNEPATIASGTKFPIISVTVVGGAQQAAITFQDVTTRLQVVPRVVPGESRLMLGVSVKRETVASTVSAGSLTAPIVNTRQTTTQLRIPDGGTVVLSGLREDSQRNREEGVPWLRKVPVLGWLFKNDLVEASRGELMVFLTAKIVENPGQAAVAPDVLPASPGAPAPPAPTGQAPFPTPPAPAVSSATPPAAARPQAAFQTEAAVER